MTWENFYLICFLVGFGLSAVSFLFSGPHHYVPHLHDHVHAHTHIHHPHTNGDMPYLNFATFSAFLAWFGGAGFLFTRYTAVWAWLGVGLAVMTGLAGASLVFWFVSNVLLKNDRALDPADYRLIGVLGRVSAAIRDGGGTGELIFTQEGSRRMVPARSEDGRGIPRDAEVVVTRYEQGIAYVKPFDELLNG